jgi:hypothetical protein
MKSSNRGFGLLPPTFATLLAVIFAGCAELGITPFRYGTVEVTAMVNDTVPVPGVRLTLYTGTRHLAYGETDETGRYVFDLVPAGVMGVAGYPGSEDPPVSPAFLAVTFNMREGAVEQVSLQFETCTGTIRVRVVDEESEPVEGAGLIVYNGAGVIAERQTPADGSWIFEGLRCRTDLAVRVDPPTGFVVEEGAGTRYFDGITLERDAVIDLQFTVERATSIE